MQKAGKITATYVFMVICDTSRDFTITLRIIIFLYTTENQEIFFLLISSFLLAYPISA